MGFQIASMSVELVGNQAAVSLQQQGEDGQYVAITLSFTISPGHYSKYQLLEKTKRLLAEATTSVQAEMVKSA
jgi:hypothetical protein